MTVTLPHVDAHKAREAYYSILGVIEEYGITTADCNALWQSHLTLAAFLLAKEGRLPDQLDDAARQFNGKP